MSAIFGEILSLGQQNGGDVQLKVFGDEHYAHYETLDGYTAIYDREMGLYCYARLAGDTFRSTGVPITGAPPIGLVRHLQESPEVVQAKAESRRIERSAVAGGHVDEEIVRTIGPNQGLLDGRVLSRGAIKGLTILVNFQDVTSTVTKADVEAMLNSPNYTGNGNICSVNEYFKKVSSNRLDYTNVVVGPYTLSRNRQFYVDTLLVEEALNLAVAAGLDLKQFDSKNDNIVDAINIMYAGLTQYEGDLWPHNFHINLRYGTMKTDLYLLTSLGNTSADLSIGTFCHENGHLLCRFPDMYDYGQRDGDRTASAGIGRYCLMGSGNHLGNGRSPSPVCAYLRNLAGWCDNKIDLRSATSFEAKHGDYNTVMKFTTSKDNEYFLVENRSKMGLDRAAVSNGLAVYHCDINGSNELQEGTATRHYQCALLQADGNRDLERNINQGDGADLFGETAGIALSAESSPHTREWDGRESGLVVADISAPGATITFSAGQSAPAQTVTGTASPNLAIPDNKQNGITSTIPIGQSGTVDQIKVSLDIKHPYRGDLRVSLTSPAGRRAVLHAQLGGSQDDLVATYDSASSGELATMVGQPMQGNWVLNVADRAAQDIGTLRKWSIEIRSASVGASRAAATGGGS